MKIYRIAGVILLTLSLCAVSCSGEDGMDGIDGKDGVAGVDGKNGTDGQDGANGQDGSDGQDGTDGQDGVGFDELAKYGHITLKTEGTWNDEFAIQDSTSFKYTTAMGSGLSNQNSITISGDEDNLNYLFQIKRFLSTPDDVYQNAYVDIYFSITNLGKPSQNIFGFTLEINDYAVITEDNKYFILNGNLGLSDDELSNITYDSATNHLTLSYSFTIPAAENVTGNDLHLSGEVDVTVLEAI